MNTFAGMENSRKFDLDTLAQSCPKIFNQILENILHFASRPHIFQLRGMSSSFRNTISKFLEKKKVPLYSVVLTGNNCSRHVENFSDFLVEIAPTELRTFRLVVEESVFEYENYDSLHRCFTSPYLQELELYLPVDGGSLPGLFPHLQLTALRRLVCHFHTERVPIEECFTRDIKPLNLTLLIQSLLPREAVLQELAFSGTPLFLPFFPHFNLVGLPNTLTDFRLEFETSPHQLQILLKNPLPNLHTLKFGSARIPYPADLIIQIMEKFRRQLRCLILGWKGQYSETPTLLHFPRMEKLKKLEIRGEVWEMASEFPNLNDVFPQLSSLKLCEQTAEMVAKWANFGSAPVEKVTSLRLSLADRSKGEYVSPDVHLFEGIRHTFPKIYRLHVVVCARDTGILRHVFGKMKKLQELKIKNWASGEIVGHEHWDNLLTGGSIDNQAHAEVGSIKLLKELRRLTLEEEHTIKEEDMGPMISQRAFTHGFRQMPKLTRIVLKGRFHFDEQ